MSITLQRNVSWSLSLTECKEHYNEMYVNGVIGEGEEQWTSHVLCYVLLCRAMLPVQVAFPLTTTARYSRDTEEKV